MISNESLSSGGSNDSRKKSYKFRTKLEKRKKRHGSKLKWNPILSFSDNTTKLDQTALTQSNPEYFDLNQLTVIRKFRGILVATESKKGKDPLLGRNERIT